MSENAAASRAPARVPSAHTRNKAVISPASRARPAGSRESRTFRTLIARWYSSVGTSPIRHTARRVPRMALNALFAAAGEYRSASLARSSATCRLRFHLRVEFGGETRPDAGAVEQVHALLAQVSEELKLS